MAARDIQAFYQAIQNGDSQKVLSMLEGSPSLLHVPNSDGEWDEISPLHIAAKYGHLDIVKELIDRGAEVYSNPIASYPPVILAAWKDQKEVVDFFLSEIPEKANGTNGLGVTIHLAARQGWIDQVRKHIEADPLAVHQRGWLGDTALHWSSHNGYVEIVELLLNAGADIEADEINWIGGKPLHWASEHAPKVVKLLLERGANVNARNIKKDSDLFEFTPLIMNASQGDDCSEATELLIAAGADPSLADANGKTAMDHAAGQKNNRILSVLKKE